MIVNEPQFDLRSSVPLAPCECGSRSWEFVTIIAHVDAVPGVSRIRSRVVWRCRKCTDQKGHTREDEDGEDASPDDPDSAHPHTEGTPSPATEEEKISTEEFSRMQEEATRLAQAAVLKHEQAKRGRASMERLYEEAYELKQQAAALSKSIVAIAKRAGVRNPGEKKP